MTTIVFVQGFLPLLPERDRMPTQEQAKGQRKRKAIELGIRGWLRFAYLEKTALNQHLAAFPTPSASSATK